MMINIKKIFPCLILCCLFMSSFGQIVSAKITFERKTNLLKKYKNDENIQRWVKEEEKIKLENFELFITDTFSLFTAQESELREKYGWLTSKNTVYQDLRSHKRYLIKSFWGEEIHVIDTIINRRWQITESTRNIAGYVCRKAVWEANDSTRIYAWFSYDLLPSTGPESFNGLPGTILGLATEDAGIVYFAKKVELIRPEPARFITPSKKKLHSMPELKAQLKKEYGHEKWFPNMLADHFGVW